MEFLLKYAGPILKLFGYATDAIDNDAKNNEQVKDTAKKQGAATSPSVNIKKNQKKNRDEILKRKKKPGAQ